MITELNLKVQPQPESSLLVGVGLSSFNAAAALLDKLAAARSCPAASSLWTGPHWARHWATTRRSGCSSASTRRGQHPPA
ncbi:MAG: hypothetical protein R2873_16355 [Caldilineaceae bacterium]